MHTLKTTFIVLLAGMLLCGCFGGDDTPEPTTDTGSHAITATTGTDTDSPEEGADTTDDAKALSEIFSLKNKVEEIRYQYLNGQPSYALKQAEGVLPMLKPDSRERLELYFLMARCSEKLGDTSSQKKHDESFRNLLEKIGNSEAQRKAHADGRDIKKLIRSSIEMAEPMREKTVFDEEDELFNLRCFRKLKRADKLDVIQEQLEDSGTIYYGKSAEKVIEQVAADTGLDEMDIVIQKDPRFYFYFTIIEGER